MKVHSVIDKTFSHKNLELAWGKVKKNRGSAGIDVPGTVDVFGGDRITVETNSRQVRDYCWVALLSVSYEIL